MVAIDSLWNVAIAPISLQQAKLTMTILGALPDRPSACWLGSRHWPGSAKNKIKSVEKS